MSATHEIQVTADVSQAREEIRQLGVEATELRRSLDGVRSPRVSILSEPLTYEARLVRDRSGPCGFRAVPTRNNYSYVSDLSLRNRSLESRERLNRHAREMEKIGEARNALFHPDVDVEFEQRAVGWGAGTGGYFAPPLWIVEWFAQVPTPERVLSTLAPQFELPVGAQSVNLPAWSAGGDVGAVQLGAAVPSTSPADTAIGSAVATIAGNFDVPLQMLEQSPQGAHLDWVAFTNMESRYGYQLELQLLIGNGATVPQGSGNNQLMGIFNNTAIPTANQVTYSGSGEGSATGATAIFTTLGLLPAKIGQNRLLPPEIWMMSTSRAAWLGSSEDLQSRPLMIADTHDSGEWDLIGFRVKLNDALPRTLGAGGNEDRIICCRPSDWLILESERRTQVMNEPLSGGLMARIQMRRYVAAILRYPSSVSYMSGSGLATGGGF